MGKVGHTIAGKKSIVFISLMAKNKNKRSLSVLLTQHDPREDFAPTPVDKQAAGCALHAKYL